MQGLYVNLTGTYIIFWLPRTSEIAFIFKSTIIDQFIYIILPLSKRGFITAIVLGFAHTLGEFGVVLMIGGNVPEKTQVISIAIYELVEQLEYTSAHLLSMTLLFFSFLF